MRDSKTAIKLCPRCAEYFQKGYKAGFDEAMQLFKKELELAYLSRPIQIRIENESEVEEEC